MNKMSLNLLTAFGAALLMACTPQTNTTKPDPKPDTDASSLIKTPDGRELCAFGVNFQTPLSWEANRLAKVGIHKTTEDLNRVTDNNIDDVVLMGAGQLRCHLTPADFTDAKGNLVESVYLDALDYMVFRAGQKGLYVSFAFLNHMGQKGPGSEWTGKGAPTWIHDPEVVSCTRNYIGQLLEHQNKYSGKCYKDMPNLAYWELINEPLMYSYAEIKTTDYYNLFKAWLSENGKADSQANYAEYRTCLVKSYIDGMYDTIRSKGDRHPVCWGLNWHRYRRENADIFAGVAASKAEIVAFCNYPGQDYVSQDYWNNSYNFTDRSFADWFNKYYKDVNGYGWAISKEFSSKAKVAYEFETFFNQAAYVYPIQALYFRALDAQAASMWTYTFNEIAPYFGGSHFLNLRCTPAKAASFIVASQIFRNTSTSHNISVADEMIGDGWCISKSHNAAVYCDSDTYCHSGPTEDGWSGINPSNSVKKVRGIGNSPIVKYTGSGIYFLDETDEGLVIRLMPDVEVLGDQFKGSDYRSVVTKLISDRENQLTIALKKWKDADCTLYDVSGDSKVRLGEVHGTLSLKPGKYLLQLK